MEIATEFSLEFEVDQVNLKTEAETMRGFCRTHFMSQVLKHDVV